MLLFLSVLKTSSSDGVARGQWAFVQAQITSTIFCFLNIDFFIESLYLYAVLNNSKNIDTCIKY